MSINDFFTLPTGVQITYAVLLWPAIWAEALITAAFVGDIGRQRKERHTHGAERHAAMHPGMRKVS